MKTIKVQEDLISLKASLNEKIYLSDLPEFKNGKLNVLFNTVFNKTITGIGGTSVVLNSSENVIVLMPFVEVVDNKEGFNSDTFIVKEGVTISSIVKYLKSPIRKIISTYDGLSKIKEAYSKAKLNIYDDFLLIDEWQVIFQQYGLRYETMRRLLSESVKFKNRCFMTATPIPKSYWFDELLNLEELILDYNIDPIILKHYHCSSILDEVAAIITSKPVYNNLHFFINSVDTIKQLVNELKLKPEDVRIICSKKDKNKYKLVGHKLSSTKEDVKPLNFYTSTCFEGCDIYDKNGLIYVLCDGAKAHSLVDIGTTLPQIAGRIRDVQDNSVNLLYTTSRYIDVTVDEFNKSVDENIRVAHEIINDVKSKETIKILDGSKANDKYLMIDEDYNLFFEEILLSVDKFNFNLVKTFSLKSNIVAKSREIFKPIEVVKPWSNALKKFQKEKHEKLPFKQQCLDYIKLKTNMYAIDNVIEHSELVKNAVDILGHEKLEELNYHKGDIKKHLINYLDISNKAKVSKNLNYNPGDFIDTNSLKEIFDKLYKLYNINKPPKGSDINDYYFTKESFRRVENNNTSRGYTIINRKIIIN